MSPGLIAKQTALLMHRGPDDEGIWCDGDVALGHRRLSIVGLGPSGHQPMSNETGSCWLTFNGELYGWRETRRELVARGHHLHGTGDSELVLHLYEDFGDDVVQHLRGEFAFGLFDRGRRRLLLARDRVGVKPLYYHDDGTRLVFASELKALLPDPSVPRDVDHEAILEYLALQYVPAPRTIWKGVRKLLPGHVLVCDSRGAGTRRYWELPIRPDPELDEAEVEGQLLTLLDEAVRLRLDAHTPIGASLSGGIDSSAVVALMARTSLGRVKTFSVGFAEEEFSELEHARRVSIHLGTDHHEEVVKPQMLETLPRLVWGLDEPFADASILPTYYLSRLASTQVKAVVSGDGGDELLAGYKTYPAAIRHQRIRFVPQGLRRALSAAARVPGGRHALGRKLRRISMSVLDRHLEAMSNFPKPELASLLAPDLAELCARSDPFLTSRAHHALAAKELGDVAALLHLDASTYMPDDVLKKVECASMLNSLEVRVPFLDHRLIEFVARLPFRFKWRGGVSKWVLKQSMKHLLPAPTLQRAKQGFSVPLERWFTRGFGHLAREVLLDPRARGRGWFNPTVVEQRIHGGDLARGRDMQQLWSLVCLELWARCYLDGAWSGISA